MIIKNRKTEKPTEIMKNTKRKNLQTKKNDKNDNEKLQKIQKKTKRTYIITTK